MKYKLEKKKLESNLSTKKLEIGASTRQLELIERILAQKTQAELERDTALLKLVTKQKSSFWSRLRSAGSKNCLHVTLGCCHTGCHEPRAGPERGNNAKKEPASPRPTAVTLTLATGHIEHASLVNEPRAHSEEYTTGRSIGDEHVSGSPAGVFLKQPDEESISSTESVHMQGRLSPCFRVNQAAKVDELEPSNDTEKGENEKPALSIESKHVDAHLKRIEEAFGHDLPESRREEGPQRTIGISARTPGAGRAAETVESSNAEDIHLCNESRPQGFPRESRTEHDVTVSQAQRLGAARGQTWSTEYQGESEGRLSPTSEARQLFTAEQKGKTSCCQSERC